MRGWREVVRALPDSEDRQFVVDVVEQSSEQTSEAAHHQEDRQLESIIGELTHLKPPNKQQIIPCLQSLYETRIIQTSDHLNIIGYYVK